ncbi:unnamed protein product [Dovyalis caffra]|uniref:Uncharacterized protein n=1 Tax=Dovyalis caffra TaxID=77055 RepID=A0AAV1RE29_9ROSI|nr:unnamed protein product [Dovyalis caffra]
MWYWYIFTWMRTPLNNQFIFRVPNRYLDHTVGGNHVSLDDDVNVTVSDDLAGNMNDFGGTKAIYRECANGTGRVGGSGRGCEIGKVGGNKNTAASDGASGKGGGIGNGE